jgi:hypothetical protein
VIAALGSALGAALAAGAGCGAVPDECALLLNCAPLSAGSSGSGGGGGTPLECIPSPGAAAVGDACGVFVSSGDKGVDAEGRGSKDKPLKSLTRAIEQAKAQNKPVYACAEEFTEALALDAGIELYGGLDCAKGWSLAATPAKTTLTAGPDQIPLTLKKEANGAKVSDFAIVAKDAMASGGSSIAVLVDQATASFVRCDVTAANGAAGPLGEVPMDDIGPKDNPSDPAIVGNDGTKACMIAGKTPGGAAKDNMFCPSSSGGPLGGNGGDGLRDNGDNGLVFVEDDHTALGGTGQAAADATLDCANAGHGRNGKPGNPGAVGDGAGLDGALGAIDASGYKGLAGQKGGDGTAGQGGGGGGGAKGKVLANCAGASGGSGGAGGCGGKGGNGGGAGGSSIGIISLNAQLSFEAVLIVTGNGGTGGDGGDGQSGGRGGKGGNGGNGNGTPNACNGGDGGDGGSGGKGGGGSGGHSLGIAHSGANEPPTEGVTITTGSAGPGGKGADETKNGAPGVKGERQKF